MLRAPADVELREQRKTQYQCKISQGAPFAFIKSVLQVILIESQDHTCANHLSARRDLGTRPNSSGSTLMLITYHFARRGTEGTNHVTAKPYFPLRHLAIITTSSSYCVTFGFCGYLTSRTCREYVLSPLLSLIVRIAVKHC